MSIRASSTTIDHGHDIQGPHESGQIFALFDDFLSACKNNKLPTYSFIEPRYANGETRKQRFLLRQRSASDHNVEQGEILIRDTFNAVWNNQQLRDPRSSLSSTTSTAVFTTTCPSCGRNPDSKNWAGNPNSLDPAFDFTRLGVRVPR